MKVVIFAGGLGTRLSELTETVPKPLVPVGGIPILMHIIDIYARQGHREFIVCCGYKMDRFVSYFDQAGIQNSRGVYCLKSVSGEDVYIRLCDTGEKTNTATRLRKVKSCIGKEDFFLTYADGLANVNVDELVQRNKESKGIVVVTAVEKTDNFGIIETSDGKTASAFYEKSVKRLINGGYMFCRNRVFECIPAEDLSFEVAVLSPLAERGELGIYRHDGFWKCMDSLKDKKELDEMADAGNEPWYDNI